VTPAQRARFDRLVERVIERLPGHVRAMLDESPIIVEDRPDDDMLRDLGMDPADPEAAGSLCGLHTGLAITERSVELDGVPSSQIHLFREGIVLEAGGWGGRRAEDAIREQIRVTILHELGHEMGLDEDDLDELGYA